MLAASVPGFSPSLVTCVHPGRGLPRQAAGRCAEQATVFAAELRGASNPTVSQRSPHPKLRLSRDDPECEVASGISAADRQGPEQGARATCWVHKTVNVLDKLPKSLENISIAATRNDVEAAFDHFIELYEAKYDKAVGCLKKDCDVLLDFNDFPADHWNHSRITNPIESTFATVRHRTIRSKGKTSCQKSSPM